MKAQTKILADWTTQSYRRGKIYASYWLGLIALDQGNYASAVDYFANRTLAAAPGSMWTPGAHYNLARSLEAGGQFQKAIDEYVGSTFSAVYAGNLVRARWLKELRK